MPTAGEVRVVKGKEQSDSEDSEAGHGQGGCCQTLEDDMEWLEKDGKQQQANIKQAIMQSEGRYHPMSPEAYTEILKAKFKDLNKGNTSKKISARDEDGEVLEHTADHFLTEDFAKQKARWYGNLQLDFWAFQKNEHPLFALLYSHPCHPVKRWEFYVIFGVNFIYSLVLAIAMEEADQCNSCGITCNSVPGSILTDCAFDLTEFPEGVILHQDRCCMLEGFGLFWFLNTFGNAGKPVFCMVFGLLYMCVFFTSMKCDCLQSKPGKVRQIGEAIGHIICGLVALWVLVWALPTCLQHLVEQPSGEWLIVSAIITLFLSKMGAWIGVFFGKGALFFMLHKVQVADGESSMEEEEEMIKDKQDMTKSGKYWVTAEDFHKYLAGGSVDETEEAYE